jgi:hypothetical protein
MVATSMGTRDVGFNALTQEQIDAGLVDPILASVAAQWLNMLGNDNTRTAALGEVQLVVRNLSGAAIASASGNTVVIDDDAAGHGWFVDGSPASSEEFRIRLDKTVLSADAKSDAYGKIDLVTVLTHELGHVLGLTHDAAEDYPVMVDELDPGTRLVLMQEKTIGQDSHKAASDQSLLKQALQTMHQDMLENNPRTSRVIDIPAFDFDMLQRSGNGLIHTHGAVDWDSNDNGWFDRFSSESSKSGQTIEDFLLVAAEDADRRSEI